MLPRSRLALALALSALTGCLGRPAVKCGPPPVAGEHAVPKAEGRVWSFDGPIGSSPDGFELMSSGGPAGRWIIRHPGVLAQEDSDRTSSRFTLAVLRTEPVGDARVEVTCLPWAGKTDRACGIVWRLRDAQNYYLARANALEDNVRLYYVQNGKRTEIASWKGAVTSSGWHRLRADMRGDHIEVYWDDQKVIDARDTRFVAAGRVGLWTKADSRTLFDDLLLHGLP
jgi:hypothetical protein